MYIRDDNTHTINHIFYTLRYNSCAIIRLFGLFALILHTKFVHYMEWTKDNLKEERTKAKLSQTALADELGVHFRTVQNWEKGTTPIPASVLPALDKLLGEAKDVVPREEYNKVVAALNSATELNKKLTDIIQSSIQIND